MGEANEGEAAMIANGIQQVIVQPPIFTIILKNIQTTQHFVPWA